MAVTRYGMEYDVEYAYQEIKGVKHKVFKTKSEWKKYHMVKDGLIPPFCLDWREAQQGEWTKGDGKDAIDRGIAEVLYRNDDLSHPSDNRFYINGEEKKRKAQTYCDGYIRTVVGSFICRPQNLMTTDFDKVSNRYRFSLRSNVKTKEYRSNSKKITAKEKQWVLATSVSNLKPESMIDIYMVIHKMENTPINRDIADKRIIRLFEKDFVVDKLLTTVKERAKAIGIDEEFVLRNYYDLATDARREDVKLSANVHCERIIGLTAIVEKRAQELLAPRTDNPSGTFTSFDEVGSEQSVTDLVGDQAVEEATVSTKVDEENAIKAMEQVSEIVACVPEISSLPPLPQPQADLESDFSPVQTEMRINMPPSRVEMDEIDEEVAIYGI